MNKKIFALSAAMCSMITVALADSFTIGDFVATKNSTIELSLYVNADAAIKNKAVSIDIIPPAGYSFATRYDEDLEEDVPDVDFGVTIMMPGVNIKEDGTLRFGCAGCTIGKGTKLFATFKVNVEDNAENGAFTTAAGRIAGVAQDAFSFQCDVLNNFNLNETIGYNTFSACAAVKVEGATVYYGKLNSDKTSVTLEEISDGIVPANTGVILGKTPGAAVTLTPSESEGTPVSSNALIPSSEVEGSVLSLGIDAGKPIFGMHSGSIPANKAFIPWTGQQNVRINFGENSIESIENDSNNIPTYNLMGQQVKTQKGIVIENGKTVYSK